MPTIRLYLIKLLFVLAQIKKFFRVFEFISAKLYHKEEDEVIVLLLTERIVAI